MTIENFNDQYLKEVLWDSLKKKKKKNIVRNSLNSTKTLWLIYLAGFKRFNY